MATSPSVTVAAVDRHHHHPVAAPAVVIAPAPAASAVSTGMLLGAVAATAALSVLATTWLTRRQSASVVHPAAHRSSSSASGVAAPAASSSSSSSAAAAVPTASGVVTVAGGSTGPFTFSSAVATPRDGQEDKCEAGAHATASPSIFSLVSNPNIASLGVDHYHHLGLNSSKPLSNMFGDVRLVILVGSPDRALIIAQRILELTSLSVPLGTKLCSIGKHERYSLYKVGPILTVSHGIGRPSASILLHEITKLLSAAGVVRQSVTYIRMGTCGGLGVKPGTIVLTHRALDGSLKAHQRLDILGREYSRPAILDRELASEIAACAPPDVKVLVADTMAADDFYEGQGRVDGAICDYSVEEKMEFLNKLHGMGVRNIEMESNVFAAFCSKLNIRAAVACVVIVNRLEGDQITATSQELAQFTEWSCDLIISYLRRVLTLGVGDKRLVDGLLLERSAVPGHPAPQPEAKSPVAQKSP